MSPQVRNAWLKICETAARAGGKELLAWQGRFEARYKGESDLVTDADLASQAAIRRVIAEQFPDHAFVGEEARNEESNDESDVGTDRMTWYVDPLDGTTNYVHGYPQYAVSVALARGSALLAGAVYDPLNEQCYSAAAGEGAWLDGRRLQVSGTTQLGDALVGVSLPARVPADSPDLADFNLAAQVCQGVRRSGSAALNLAYVARGWLDAFWATHIHAWDVAAGVLLVREAGGVVTARDGGEFDLSRPHFISAANASLSGAIRDTLTPFRRVP